MGRLFFFLFLCDFLIILSTFESASATAQMYDKLVLGDSTYDLATAPLEPHLDSAGRRPELTCSGHLIVSSGNWRGYVATWKLERDSLWLLTVEHECPKGGDQSSNQPTEYEYQGLPVDSFIAGAVGPVFARWYTGTLRLPKGRMLRYVHMGYGSIFEKEAQITIVSGQVTSWNEVGYDSATEYRSRSDLQWCAITGSFVDTGNWIDARLIGTEYTREFESSGKPFKTRGDLFVQDGRVKLWIERTPRTEEKTVYLISESPINEDDISGPVEVEVRIWGPRRQHRTLLVSIRTLDDGETIHSSRYPAIIDSLCSLRERKGK